MSTETIEQKLQAELRRWETVAMYAADQACFDSQINSLYRTAQEKQAKIALALQRVESGAYPLCDTCGRQIEAERLELLADSDCRLCAVCAWAAAEAKQMQRPHRPLHKPSRSYRFPDSALEMVAGQERIVGTADQGNADSTPVVTAEPPHP